MKNGECTFYITTKHGWTQTGPNGIVRSLSAGQLLSHILPRLTGNSDHASVRVEPDAAK